MSSYCALNETDKHVSHLGFTLVLCDSSSKNAENPVYYHSFFLLPLVVLQCFCVAVCLLQHIPLQKALQIIKLIYCNVTMMLIMSWLATY